MRFSIHFDSWASIATWRVLMFLSRYSNCSVIAATISTCLLKSYVSAIKKALVFCSNFLDLVKLSNIDNIFARLMYLKTSDKSKIVLSIFIMAYCLGQNKGNPLFPYIQIYLRIKIRASVNKIPT